MFKPPPASSQTENLRILGILRATRLFSELGDVDLRNISLCSEIRSVPKRTYLFHAGDSPAGFFVVGKGAVNVHRLDEEGRETVIRVFREGESFGELFLADAGPSPVSARIESTATLLLVRRSDLSNMIASRPEIAMRLLASMSRHLRSLVDKLGSLQHRTVSERLREWLLARCSDEDGPAVVAIPPRKYLLAAEIGTVPETLSRTLTKFRERGWILTEGNSITVVSPANFAEVDIEAASN